MISLDNVKEWIKTLDVKFDNYYIGILDKKKDKSLGVYNLKRSSLPIKALGNLGSYQVKSISLLIHYNNATDATEEVAFNLYESIMNAKVDSMGNHVVHFVNMLTNEPVDVGRDDKGICEYVIEFEIYYKKLKEENL